MANPLPRTASGPAPGEGAPDVDALRARLTRLLAGALDVWGSPAERRRMRMFGFRPAVEEGVLKREWHDLRVRVRPGLVTVSGDGGITLSYSDEDRTVRLDGEPFQATRAGLALAEGIVGLIEAYERWVEAREGRDERLRRARVLPHDVRPVNALAETRRIRRILSQTRGRPGRR
jgi:hypothetical protein